MKEIALIGFGTQGNKAVSDIETRRRNVKKIFVDKYPDLLQPYRKHGQLISVAFHYEMGAWEPCYELKAWLEEEDNIAALKTFLDEFSMLILVTGLGGTMSLTAKELALFVKRQKPELPVYFVCSLPFHEETDFQNNVITDKVLEFLHTGQVGWSITDNSRICNFYGNDFSKAYEISSKYLSLLIEGFLDFFGEGFYHMKNEFSDIRELLSQGLIHMTVWELPDSYTELPGTLENQWLPYQHEENGGKVVIALELAEGTRVPGFLRQLETVIGTFFSQNKKVSYRIYHGKKAPYSHRYVIASAGKERYGQKISAREILLG